MEATRRRRLVMVGIVLFVLIGALIVRTDSYMVTPKQSAGQTTASPALAGLAKLPVKGRAAKTGYTRAQFGDGWATKNDCDTRNIILARDMKDEAVNVSCQVTKGTLDDPYTGKTIEFMRGPTTSASVQIDHVVALGNAWQTGAQNLEFQKRVQLANDPLELLAVDGPANQQKSDGDAATWLPPNKIFRCAYVARQIAVKLKYNLWVTSAEHDAMARVLAGCPEQIIPTEK